MSGTFWVFKCTKCGRWGVKEIRTKIHKSRFNCKYCGKILKITHKEEYGLALINKGPYKNPRDATSVCQYLNGMMGKKQGEDKEE